MIEWLYRASIESTVIVTVLMLLGPLVRRALSAQIVYWMWSIPFLAILFFKKPERPEAVFEFIELPGKGLALSMQEPVNSLTHLQSTLILGIWLSGVALWLAMRFVAWRSMKKSLAKRSREVSLDSITLASIPAHLANVKTQFYETDVPGAPFVTGLRQAKIYLPKGFNEKYSEDEKKWVITHELTHIQRLDLWGQFAAELFRACFWFNPLMYFASRSFREDQELACDHQVTRCCGIDERRQYGEAMLRGMSAVLMPTALAFFNLKKERFIMLKKHKKSKTKSILGVLLCLIVSLFIVTRAPSVIATDEYDKSELIRASFKHSDLSAIVNTFGEFMGLEIRGQGPLKEKVELVTLTLEDYPASEALRFVLNCNGFDFEIRGGAIHVFDSEKRVDNTQCAMLSAGVSLKDESSASEFALLKKKIDHTDVIVSLMNSSNVEQHLENFLDKHPLGLSHAYIESNVKKVQSAFGPVKFKDMKFHLKSEYEYEINVQVWSEKRQQIYYFNYYVSNSDAPTISGIDFRVENVKI